MKRLSLLLIAALVLLVAVSLASAQTGDWALNWYTIDGGSATSTGGARYTLSGTTGQPDAGRMSGGVYSLYGGFWQPADREAYEIYLPLIQK